MLVLSAALCDVRRRRIRLFFVALRGDCWYEFALNVRGIGRCLFVAAEGKVFVFDGCEAPDWCCRDAIGHWQLRLCSNFEFSDI